MKFTNSRLVRGLAITAMAFALTAPTLAQGGGMRSTDGGRVSLDSLRGQVSVLAFGGLLDPQSYEELPVLQRIADRYAGRVSVYWVSLDPDRAGVSGAVTDSELSSFAGRNGFRGPVLRDPAGDMLRSIGTGRRAQLPTFVVVDANGMVAGQPITGFDRDADLVNQLAAQIDRLVR